MRQLSDSVNGSFVVFRDIALWRGMGDMEMGEQRSDEASD